MSKGARKRAAKYSELSKGKRRKQRAKLSPETQTVSVSSPGSIVEPKPAAKPSARPVSRTQSETKRGLLDYQYVRADLKRIAVLAGAMLLVLIILTFVLG